jgi:hypothetical protein
MDATLTLAQPTTWFVVMDSDAAATQQHLIDGNTNRNTLYIFTDTKFHLFAGSDVAGAASDTNSHVLCGVFNGASSNLRVDGGAGTSGAAGAQGVSTILRIGCESGAASGFMDGRIAEIIGYDSALSVANINLVGNYLGTKWGITWTTAT